jgi:hypothetical protein
MKKINNYLKFDDDDEKLKLQNIQFLIKTWIPYKMLKTKILKNIEFLIISWISYTLLVYFL